MMKLKLVAMGMVLAMAQVANAESPMDKVSGQQDFLGCDWVGKLAKSTMQYRLEGVSKEELVESVQEHFGENEFNTLYGVELVNMVFNLEQPNDQGKQKTMVSQFAKAQKNYCVKNLVDS